MATVLDTPDAVIDALEGRRGVSQLLTAAGYSCSPNAVGNWKVSERGKLPPETFLILKAELAHRGFDAPSSLWGIPEPASTVAA